jgi:hypothetical protein
MAFNAVAISATGSTAGTSTKTPNSISPGSTVVRIIGASGATCRRASTAAATVPSTAASDATAVQCAASAAEAPARRTR